MSPHDTLNPQPSNSNQQQSETVNQPADWDKANPTNLAQIIARNPQEWFNYMQASEAAHIEKQKFNESLSAQVEQLSKQVAKLRKASTPSSTPAPVPVTKTEKLPDPEPFDGARDKLENFVFGLRVKYQVNADRYDTEGAKLAHAYSLLRGNAQAQVLPRLQSDFDKIVTVDQLFAHLERSFGDSDKKGTAQRIIGGLRMKNRPFAEYLADFQRYIEDTGYNTDARKSLLEAGLFNELKDYLINTDVRELSYEDLISKCHMIDGRHRVKQAATKARNFSPAVFGTPSPKPSYGNTVSSAPRAPVSHTSSPGGEPMDISITNAKKRGSLTAEEKQHRLTNNLCLYCGGPGHQASGCPNKPKQTFVRAATFGSASNFSTDFATPARAAPVSPHTSGGWPAEHSNPGNA